MKQFKQGKNWILSNEYVPTYLPNFSLPTQNVSNHAGINLTKY